MNPANYLKLIRYLTVVLHILDIKWKRPMTGFELKVIEQLKEVRRELHIAYKLESGLELPSEYEYPGSEIE